MSSIKDRLRAKLNAKRAPTKPPTQSKIPKVDGVTRFVLILRQHPSIQNIHNEDIDMVHCERFLQLERISEKFVQDMKGFSKEQVEAGLSQINLALDAQWVDKHIESLCEVEESDIHALVNSKIAKFQNHHIILRDVTVNAEQLRIEFLGLCWLQKYGKDDIGRDVIVSVDSWRYYMHLYIGMEFFNVFSAEESLLEYIKEITINNVNVISREYGTIKYPTDAELMMVRDYIDAYPFWSSYLNPTQDY
jgi:hypothetical protein